MKEITFIVDGDVVTGRVIGEYEGCLIIRSKCYIHVVNKEMREIERVSNNEFCHQIGVV